MSDLEEFSTILARVLIKLVEEERGRPFGAMLGLMAKGELTEKEYLLQFLKEEWPQKKRKD